MKRVVFVALIAVFMISLGVAHAATKMKSSQPCEVENVSGKVDSITPVDPAATDIKPTITVVDNKGEKTVFTITPTTTLYDANVKPITLDAIKQGASVMVKGTCATEGTGVATSVRLLNYEGRGHLQG